MGATTYSSTGVPSGVTIPAETLRAAPNDWEATNATTYSHTLTGTITFNGGVFEEYFTHSGPPVGATGNILSELGKYATGIPGPPEARVYTEQFKSDSVQSITVATTSEGTYSLSTAAGSQFPNSDFLMPFVDANAFAHSQGSTGVSISASYSIGVALATGYTTGPLALTQSDGSSSATQAGGTAASAALSGSTAYPSGGVLLPGGGQKERGSVKIGWASTQIKLMIPEEIIVSGALRRLPGQANDLAYSVNIGQYAGGSGIGYTILHTLTGITGTFSQTYSYEPRATRCFASSGKYTGTTGLVTIVPGGSWYTAKTNWPDRAGVWLSGGDSSDLAIKRLCARGKRWALYDALLPDETLIGGDPWPSGITGGSGTTISTSGAVLSITTTGGALGPYATLPTTVPMPECRYHKIRVRSVGSANQSVRLRRASVISVPGQHSYDFFVSTGADGAWSEFDLDPLGGYSGLCHEITAGTVPQGLYNWRIDVPLGVVIEVAWIKALRRTFARLDHSRRRWDFDIAALVGTVDGSPYSLVLPPSDELSVAFGGWDLSAATPASGSKAWGHDLPINDYVTTLGPHPQANWYDSDNALYVAGGGLMFNSPSWETFINQDFHEGAGGFGTPVLVGDEFIAPPLPKSVFAQDVFERVELYPGCGDVFGHSGGGYNPSTTLRFGLLLGGAVHGLELGEIESGGAWPDVVAYETPANGGAERARGDALTAEHYALTTPDVRGTRSYVLRLDPEEDIAQSLSITGEDRKIYRTLWLLSINLSDPLAVDTVRRRIVSAQGKRLACYHAESRALDVLSPEHPPTHWLSLDIDPHGRHLWALGKLGSELVLYMSQDWGNTIWEAIRMTAKSGVVIADPVRGVTVVYYEAADGTVQQLLRLADGSTVGPTSVKLSGVALTARVLGGDTDEWAAGRHLVKVRQAGTVKVIAGQDLAGATFEPWIV